MATQRIKGQEVEVSIVSGTSVIDAITDIPSMSLNFDIQILEDGFLGRTANEYDEIFNGMKGDISFQVRRKRVFDFVTKIKDKAQRRTPGEMFSMKTTLNFPSGETARIILPDIHFGAIPLNVGNRQAFVELKLDFACSACRIL